METEPIVDPLAWFDELIVEVQQQPAKTPQIKSALVALGQHALAQLHLCVREIVNRARMGIPGLLGCNSIQSDQFRLNFLPREDDLHVLVDPNTGALLARIVSSSGHTTHDLGIYRVYGTPDNMVVVHDVVGPVPDLAQHLYETALRRWLNAPGARRPGVA